MPQRWNPWKDAAHELDGTLDIEVGTASSEVRVGARIDGVDIEALGTSTPYAEGRDSTVVRANAPGSAGMRLRITTGSAPALARLLGEREVEIGLPAFDLRFKVFASDIGFAKSWLGVKVRKQIVAATDYEYALRGSEATAEIARLEQDSDRLIAAIRAVAALAEQALRIEREWSRCAAEIGGVLDEEPTDTRAGQLPSYTVRHGGGEIRVARFWGRAGRSRRKQLFTSAACARTTHTPDTYVMYQREHGRHLRAKVRGASESIEPSDPRLSEYAIDCESPERTQQRLSLPMIEHISTVEPALIRADRQHVTVLLWGVVRDQERLQSAVTLAHRLAVEIDAGAVGPYR